MTTKRMEFVRGSGNVFRDIGTSDPDVEQAKSILAAEIIKTLNREELTVRAAHARTRIAAADFSRIRNANLGRFTVDRLITILNRLGARVDIKIRVHRAEVAPATARLTA
jgi:predicted XRE-type DNA-binding protein